MKVLKRMLLINWYYFVKEIIEFEKINFLTGKNSSGKSTILDAMQLVLLGDTSSSYFNKAARDKGDRTLIGYLMCELGDDEGSGFRYLREAPFSSYIVLEFHDDTKKSIFSVGCCFDIYSEKDYPKLFFRFDSVIPDNNFIIENKSFNIDKLRAFIRENYSGQHYMTSTNRDFREDLCGKLGGLQPKRFSDLLKKAVSFDPEVKIREFITQFVCGDEQEINITDMKENIRSYDLLRKEAIHLKERIDLLLKIDNAYNDYSKNKENEKLYSYLIDRSQWEIIKNETEKQKIKLLKLKNELNELKQKLSSAEAQQKQLQSERDVLKLQLDSNENARRLEELEREINEKKLKFNEWKNGFNKYSALLQNSLSSWRDFFSKSKNIFKDYDLSFMEELLQKRIEELLEEGKELLKKSESLLESSRQAHDNNIIKTSLPIAQVISKTDKDSIYSLSCEAASFKDRCSNLADRLNEKQKETVNKQNELKKEKEQLEGGKYQFPKDAVDLKEAIESRLRTRFGPDAKAVILAEAAEIRDEKWRNAIEGYLHTQKFYIITAPEHFYTAFQLYDSIKREKAVYTTGLVDTEKLQKMEPVKDEGSLAEELETDNPAVRLFINFTLGRVHKSDSIKELRKFKTSITYDGVLYQNFVVRAIDPRRWNTPAIGKSGAKLRLENVNKEIIRLQHELSVFAAIISVLHEKENFLLISKSEAEEMIRYAKQCIELPVLEEAIKRLIADAESIDKSELEEMRRRLNEREKEIVKISENIKNTSHDIGSSENNIKICELETLPKLEKEAIESQINLETTYQKNWIDDIGAQRYEKELLNRENVEEIKKAFPREQSRSRNAKDDAWKIMRDCRIKFNETYKTGYDVESQDNDAYKKICFEYTENKLPDYELKIADTRQKAYQQFQEDFLSKLQSNIRNTKTHIDELNSSMKNASFGEDTYQFRITANPEYKRFYDMIIDEMLLTSGYNLGSENFNSKYKEELNELFDIITNDSGTPNVVNFEDYEKRVRIFTDYKTYLQFDLEVSKPNGESERLSKTMGKKSGGETQTPFYIAVLASFVQLYRIGREKVPNTARLILFDEAFSKMDGERIVQSLDLLRRFNFQVVFAAPPNKIPDIGVLADRNLCVLRDGHKTCVRSFDPKQLEALAGDD